MITDADTIEALRALAGLYRLAGYFDKGQHYSARAEAAEKALAEERAKHEINQGVGLVTPERPAGKNGDSGGRDDDAVPMAAEHDVLVKEAEQHRGAMNAAACQQVATPEPAAKDGNTGGRPEPLIWRDGERPAGPWLHKDAHDILVAWLDARIAALERENTELQAINRRDNAYLTKQETDWRARAEAAEKALAEERAGAAVIRAALEVFPRRTCGLPCVDGCNAVSFLTELGHDTCKRRADALATGAGRELLEAARAIVLKRTLCTTLARKLRELDRTMTAAAVDDLGADIDKLAHAIGRERS